MYSFIPQMKCFVIIGLFIFLNILKIICAQTTPLNANIVAFDGNVTNGSSQTPQTFINRSVNETNEAIESTSTASTVLPRNETNKSNENIAINETQADNTTNVTEKQLLQTSESLETADIHWRRAQSFAPNQTTIITDTTIPNRSEQQLMLTTSKPSLVAFTAQNSSETNLIKESLANTASNPIIPSHLNSIDDNSTNSLLPNLISQNFTISPINRISVETIATNFENETQEYDTRNVSSQSFTTIQNTISFRSAISLGTNQTSGLNTRTQSHDLTANSTTIPLITQTDTRKHILKNFVILPSNNHTTTQNLNNDIKTNRQSERSFATEVTTLNDSNKTELAFLANNTVTDSSDSLVNETIPVSFIANTTLQTSNDSLSSILNSFDLNTTERFTASEIQNISTVNLSANISSLPHSSTAKDILYSINSSNPSIDTSFSSFATQSSPTNGSNSFGSKLTSLTSADTVMNSTVKSTQNPNFPQYNNTVHLPMVKDIHSISKHDMSNIATITFIAEVIDIFQWVSITDIKFRNFICKLIDDELKWCTIFKFVYISPSPTVTNNHLYINFFIQNYIETENEITKYEAVYPGALIVDAFKNDGNLTTNLEKSVGLKIVNLHTKVRTLVFNTADTMERRENVDLYVFFTVIMLICTVLLCLAIICSCARHKGNNMTQIELSNNAGISAVRVNGGIDLNSASNILREENQQKRYTNVINNEDCWVAPLDQIIIENEKIAKSDTLSDTRL